MQHQKLLLFTWILGLALSAKAQEATTATGGDISGSGGTVAFSVGQPAYTFQTGSNGNEWQGVQQVYTIQSSSVPDPDHSISLTAFPNPASDQLTLQINNFSDEKLSYSLYEEQGKLLSSKAITGGETHIDMSGLSSATYMITVAKDNKILQSFKIIKKQ